MGMSTIDCRALLSYIAEQLTSATDPDDLGIRAGQLVEQIGAALDQPPAAGPTAADFRAWWQGFHRTGRGMLTTSLEQTAMAWAEFCLDRWGRPAAVPVPVSERLPGEADCAPWPDSPSYLWCWAGRVLHGAWE